MILHNKTLQNKILYNKTLSKLDEFKSVFLFFAKLTTFFLIASCTSIPDSQIEFKKFSNYFEATQVVHMKSQDRDDTLLASLKRNGKDYNVTFLIPSIQAPLLGVSYINSKYEIKKYVDLKDFPIPPEEILKSIMAVYNQPTFKKQNVDLNAHYYTYKSKDFDYELHDVQIGDANCGAFPHIIQLTSKLKYKFVLDVKTTDLSCEKTRQ